MANPAWLKPEDNSPSVASRDLLPLGCYVAEIIGAKKESNKIKVQFDIIEGEHAHYFHADYEARKGGKYPYTYKGNNDIWLPTGDGSDDDSKTIKTFNSIVWALEKSNPGYHFDFERIGDLVGKKIGIMVREYYWGMTKDNGDHIQGVTHKVGGFCDIEKARKAEPGKSLLKPKYSKEYIKEGTAPASSSVYTPVDLGEELPF